MNKKDYPSQTNTIPPQLQLSLESVPVDGALGLLAYGDISLVAWRDKRTQVEGPDWRQKLAEELLREERLYQDTEERGAQDEEK